MGWKQGSLIMEAHPYVHVIMQKYREERCNFCLKRSENLKKCAACKKIWYCGMQCQKKDWKLHKVECPVMKRVPDTPTDSMRLFLRLVIRHMDGASSVTYDKEEKPCIRSFNDLMSHSNEMRSDRTRSSQFEVAHDFLRAYTHGLLTLPPATQLLDIFGRMVINTFTIADESLQDVAVGIYNSPSILDHSCEPNAVASFNGRTLSIRALADIDSTSFEEVFLGYVDPLATTSERQEQLQEQYYFTCTCNRCSTNEIDKMMCLVEEGCEGDLAKVKFCLDKLESMQKGQESPQNILETCEKCVSEVNLPSTNVHFVRLLSRGFDAAIEGQQFEKALTLGTRKIEPYGMLHPPYSPCVGYMYANLGKLMHFLFKLKEAEVHLIKSLEILIVALGKDHELIHQIRDILSQCQAELRAS